jgi:hypothetical protein
MFKKEDFNSEFIVQCKRKCFSSSIHLQCEHKRCSLGIFKCLFSYAKSIIDETGLDILQLQNTTSSNQVKLPKKYVKSTLKFYYEKKSISSQN